MDNAVPSALQTSEGHIYFREFSNGDVLVRYFRTAPIAQIFRDLIDGRARYHEAMSEKNPKYRCWIIPARNVSTVIADLDAI